MKTKEISQYCLGGNKEKATGGNIFVSLGKKSIITFDYIVIEVL